MPDRFASISTLLPTRPAAKSNLQEQASTSSDVEVVPATDETPASTAQPTSVESRTRRRAVDQPKARASDTADGGTRRVAFRLEPDLHQQLSERAAQTKTSKGNVVLDAIEDAHAAGALTPAASQSTRSSMFARTPDRGPAAATVLVEIRLTSQAVRTLDQLVENTGQPTRTQLLHAALAHHFQGRPTTNDGQA